MIPGLGGNPRQMAMMMRQLGIEVNDLHNVRRVVVETEDGDYIFDKAGVSIMKAKGVETWQISGTPRKTAGSGSSATPVTESEPEEGSIAASAEDHHVQLEFTDEDVQLVAEQAGVDAAKARSALETHGGDVASAIVALMDESN